MKKNSVKFGAVSADITPPQGACLAGYFTKREAEGVLDPLYAKILVLDKYGEKLALAACDLIGVPSGFARALREMISERTGIPAESVMVSATHTHTGPVMSGPLADREYLERIKETIASSAAEAASSLREGLLESGSSPLPGHAFNRRYFMKDGSVLTNPGAGNPDAVRPAGPVDDSVNVIVLREPSGRPGALLVNTALHPDTVSGSKISADWPGYLSLKAAGELGEDVPVLVVNGTQGDINHFDVFGGMVEQGIEVAKKIGSAYGGKVLEICRSAAPVEIDGLGSAFRAVEIPRRRITDGELAEAERIVREYGEEHDIEQSGRILESQDIARGDKAVKVFFAKSTVRFNEKFKGTSALLEIQALRIGEIAVCGIGGEVFTEIGLEIKKKSPFKHTLVAALANGYNGYLVTAKAFREGGYETMPRDTSQFGPEAEELITGASLDLLGSLA